MALADDVTSLESALTTVQGAALPAAQIVTLLDVAILKPVVSGGRIYASYSIGGRTVQMAISDAQALREYYRQVAQDEDHGGLVPQWVEFG